MLSLYHSIDSLRRSSIGVLDTSSGGSSSSSMWHAITPRRRRTHGRYSVFQPASVSSQSPTSSVTTTTNDGLPQPHESSMMKPAEAMSPSAPDGQFCCDTTSFSFTSLLEQHSFASSVSDNDFTITTPTTTGSQRPDVIPSIDVATEPIAKVVGFGDADGRLDDGHRSEASSSSVAASSGLSGVADWSVSLDRLLGHVEGAAAFAGFLRGEFSDENLEFHVAVTRFRAAPSEAAARRLVARFVGDAAPAAVNIDAAARRAVETAMAECQRVGVFAPTVFDAAHNQIYTLMKMDCFPRFLKSAIYQSRLQREQAVEQEEKAASSVDGSHGDPRSMLRSAPDLLVSSNTRRRIGGLKALHRWSRKHRPHKQTSLAADSEFDRGGSMGRMPPPVPGGRHDNSRGGGTRRGGAAVSRNNSERSNVRSSSVAANERLIEVNPAGSRDDTSTRPHPTSHQRGRASATASAVALSDDFVVPGLCRIVFPDGSRSTVGVWRDASTAAAVSDVGCGRGDSELSDDAAQPCRTAAVAAATVSDVLSEVCERRGYDPRTTDPFVYPTTAAEGLSDGDAPMAVDLTADAEVLSGRVVYLERRIWLTVELPYTPTASAAQTAATATAAAASTGSSAAGAARCKTDAQPQPASRHQSSSTAANNPPAVVTAAAAARKLIGLRVRVGRPLADVLRPVFRRWDVAAADDSTTVIVWADEVDAATCTGAGSAAGGVPGVKGGDARRAKTRPPPTPVQPAKAVTRLDWHNRRLLVYTKAELERWRL